MKLHLSHLFIFCFLTFNVGCGHNAEPIQLEEECGGHGHLHGEHCHCDAGYVLSKDESTCEKSMEMEMSMDMGMDDKNNQDKDMSMTEEDMGPLQAPPFQPTAQKAVLGKVDGKNAWQLRAEDRGASLSVEVYEALGGPSSPQTVTMTEKSTSYATCGTCLVLRTGCTGQGSEAKCTRTYMPRATGEVKLDALGLMVGDKFTGQLKGIVFQEVFIAPTTFETVPVKKAPALAFEDWAFDATLQMGSGMQMEPECSGHGHIHGNTCHCNPGYKTDPQDSTKCIPL